VKSAGGVDEQDDRRTAEEVICEEFLRWWIGNRRAYFPYGWWWYGLDIRDGDRI
jgi:hypothetical protein